jgi:hypothetical protein
MTTPYHAKYFAHELSRIGGSGVDRIGRALFDASVDLNPHQIDAALFALRSPISKGVILADEVGLGKTIEASLVLCIICSMPQRLLMDDDLDDDLLDQLLEDEEDLAVDEPAVDKPQEETRPQVETSPEAVDINILDAEILELEQYTRWARSIGIDTKTRSLLTALEVGFTEMQNSRAPDEIEQAFQLLQAQLEDQIQLKTQKTHRLLLEHFDEDVHDLLKVNLSGAQEQDNLMLDEWFKRRMCDVEGV